MKKLAAIAALIALAGLIACSKPSGQSRMAQSGSTHWALSIHKPSGNDDKPVAKVGDVKIYASEIKKKLERQSPVLRARYKNASRLKDYINNNLVRNEVLVLAAIDEGVDKDPEVVEAARQMMIQRFIRKKLEEKVKLSDISEEEIKEYYEAHKNDYIRPEQRRASHILIKPKDNTPKAWKEAEKRAKELYQKIVKECGKHSTDPRCFAEFARKYSEDRGNAALGGDLGYFARTEEGGRMVKEFSDAVFGIENIGDIVGPVKTKFGYHIIKLTGIRKRREQQLEQVRNSIRNILYKQKRASAFDKLIQDLKRKYEVKLYDEAIKALVETRPDIFEEGKPGIKPKLPPNRTKPNYANEKRQTQPAKLKPTHGSGEPKHAPTQSKPTNPTPAPKTPTKPSNTKPSGGTK